MWPANKFVANRTLIAKKNTISQTGNRLTRGNGATIVGLIIRTIVR